MIDFLNNWTLDPAVWLMVGIALIIIDMIVGLNFFVLPVGIAAILVSALLKLQSGGAFETSLVDDWEEVMYVFSALSIVAIGIVKLLFQPTKKPDDINQY